jgi:signal transduction histidine kinase
MPMAHPKTILVVSDESGFARELSERWQSERVIPNFIVQAGHSLSAGGDPGAFDLAIVHLRNETVRSAVQALERTTKPVLVVAEPSEASRSLRRDSPRVLLVPLVAGWAETVVLLASEVFRRIEAVHRAERAEQINALLKCHATLGQYVIEMRHSMNNALTSVLGHSELLLLEPGAFSAGVHAQIDTIRNMALRMHEILQRFSSLEKELTFVEQQAAKEQMRKSAALQ